MASPSSSKEIPDLHILAARRLIGTGRVDISKSEVFAMTSHNWLEQLQLLSDSEIVAVCGQQSTHNGTSYNSLVYPSIENPIAFIKYGPAKLGIIEEKRNQVFAFEMLQSLPLQTRRGIQIPEIYSVIEEEGMVYVVMEYVRGQALAGAIAIGDSNGIL
jgi:hypothetical protein